MCGISCVIGSLNYKDKLYIDNMIVMQSLRGTDSIGVTTVGSDVKSFKKAVLPHDFLDLNRYKKFREGSFYTMLMHSRWATRGLVNANNAHPFTEGDITGCHNGSLTGQWRLPDNKDFKVDSQNIIYAINKEGIEETWKKIDGAAALVWWNDEDETLNFIRNKERPLTYCFNKAKDKVYLASEKFMMLAAMDRNSLYWGDVIDVPINTLHTIDLDVKGTPTLTTKELTPFIPTTSIVRQSYTSTLSNRRQQLDKSIRFRVKSWYKNSYSTIYSCVDITNANTLYEIEDFKDELRLQNGTEGTATTSYLLNNVMMLRLDSIKTDVVIKGDEMACDWCQMEIKDVAYAVYSTAGEVFCKECADLNNISDFIEVAV